MALHKQNYILNFGTKGGPRHATEVTCLTRVWVAQYVQAFNFYVLQLRREGESVLARLENLDDDFKNNLEKIVGLEEAHVTQLEKAVYVESLASRVTAIDEQKQMVNISQLFSQQPVHSSV